MKNDGFDYDELSRSVDDLLNDEYGLQEDVFAEELPGLEDLPEQDYVYRNAANRYGAAYDVPEEPVSTYDEEAAAMRYDPQTNTGAVIRAYNADYATRAVQRSKRREKGAAPKAAPQRPAQARAALQPQPQGSRNGAATRTRQAEPRREETRRAPEKKKKKHGFLKFLLILLLLLGLAVAALWLFARAPEADALAGRRDGCSAILLAGTDVEGVRTDTMMLLYLDAEADKMSLLSIPRDTYTSMDTAVPKLNGVYGIAGGGREGMERLLDYTSECIGYRPDGYVLIDLDCFESLVNLMGGVRFDVPMDMSYEDPAQDLYIDLKAGEQKLNGKEAMWVVRFRSGYAAADLQRVQVQRDFIRAAMDQWLTLGNLWKAPAAATLLTANTTTNLSLGELAWIAKTARSIGAEKMQTDTLPGEGAYVGDGSYYVLWPETTARLINESYNPYQEEVSPEDIFSPYY